MSPRGYTPPPEVITSKKKQSMGFMIALSIVLGATIAAGTLISTFGNAFYVTRSEYQGHEKNDIEVTTTFRQTLGQIDKTLAAQAASFKDLAASVENVRLEMARKR